MTYADIQTLIVENLASGIEIPAIDHREVETAMLNYINDNLPKQFDIKYIYADSTYLGNNFETNGLGKNLRLGWALCNGATHSGVATPNLGGRMIVSYGGDFTTLNAIGGNKDAIIVTHTHTISNSMYSNSDTGSGKFAVGGQGVEGTAPTIEATGESGTDKNMPPYYTLIGIMKL
jgi:hypothetical protein